ncbi:MAG: hypothetical protein ACI9I8_002005 [Cellvibrionaceae bacterium]|jgi:hypothetical protein
MSISSHSFHIPVMGIGYTLDTPIKVAKYGISSVISIVQDDVIEKARKYYSHINKLPYEPIHKKDAAYRPKRITAYLNLVKHLVNQSFEQLKRDPLPLRKYTRMLPGNSNVEDLQEHLNELKAGSIDVNIMTKLDRQPSSDEGVYTDACASLKGYAESDLDSCLVLSAGINPRLFAYMEEFRDFFPDEAGHIKKRIIVKVSDFRSAAIQGKMLAKKGLWVSEYRLESGLNCGGHTFATDGLLMGPILEEFKLHRDELLAEQELICKEVWKALGHTHSQLLVQKLTVQGGLGTSNERLLLEDFYGVDGTGWGSPFLLVPEATSIDHETLAVLTKAGEKDIYNSDVSPLGVSFSTVRGTSGDRMKNERISADKPGSPCHWKHLAMDTSYKAAGVCVASSSYQKRKIQELKAQNLSQEAYDASFARITEKECLCDGLAVSFLKKFDLMDASNFDGVSVCPGPNLAYFDRTYSLEEMVEHIYGKQDILEKDRPHVFLKELGLYMTYYEKLKNRMGDEAGPRKQKQLTKFRENLLSGISYYSMLALTLSDAERAEFEKTLKDYSDQLETYAILSLS